jgi:hypothetical protein
VRFGQGNNRNKPTRLDMMPKAAAMVVGVGPCRVIPARPEFLPRNLKSCIDFWQPIVLIVVVGTG